MTQNLWVLNVLNLLIYRRGNFVFYNLGSIVLPIVLSLKILDFMKPINIRWIGTGSKPFYQHNIHGKLSIIRFSKSVPWILFLLISSSFSWFHFYLKIIKEIKVVCLYLCLPAVFVYYKWEKYPFRKGKKWEKNSYIKVKECFSVSFHVLFSR